MPPRTTEHPFFRAGWFMVGFTGVLQFFSFGVGYYTFGVFLKPLVEGLQTDRFSVSLTLSIQMTLMALIGPKVGKLLAEKSLRLLLCTGVLSISVGLVICSYATHLWFLYLGFGFFVAIGMVLTSTLPSSMLLANWFVRKRGSAMGISQFGITISGTVLVPITAWIIVNFDWRAAFLTFAIVTPAILLPLIWKFAVRQPEDIGLYPDGDREPQKYPSDDSETAPSLRTILRIRDIWLIAFIAGPTFMAIASVVLVLPSHATDLGIGTLEASSIVAITTLMGAFAKPLLGILADHLNKRLVVCVAIILQIIGVLILLSANSFLSLSIAGAVFGLGYGGMAPLQSVLIAERFGKRTFAYMMGAMMPLITPFSLIALPMTTLFFETTGSYLPAFALLLLGYILSLICLLGLRLPAKTKDSSLT